MQFRLSGEHWLVMWFGNSGRTEHLVLSHVTLKRCTSSSSVTSFCQIMCCYKELCRVWDGCN